MNLIGWMRAGFGFDTPAFDTRDLYTLDFDTGERTGVSI
jgi:hypothetical protein